MLALTGKKGTNYEPIDAEDLAPDLTTDFTPLTKAIRKKWLIYLVFDKMYILYKLRFFTLYNCERKSNNVLFEH